MLIWQLLNGLLFCIHYLQLKYYNDEEYVTSNGAAKFGDRFQWSNFDHMTYDPAARDETRS